MQSTPVPKHVFVAYYPAGPHAGPITLGLFGFKDGALLPVFSSRDKAIDFAIRTLGSPPNRDESWDGVELPAVDLMQLLLADGSIVYVATDPTPSGDVELATSTEFLERLEPEARGAPREDFRRSMVRTQIYGDVS